MMKNVSKIIFSIFCFFAFSCSVGAINTLKDMKDELAKDEANMASIIKQKEEAQRNIDKIEGEIDSINAEIESCQAKIDESKQKIIELDEKIVEKNKEIDNLFSFLQISGGDNVYLEYIFGASDFTDFIYRSAVVEQLTNYNDGLIDEMYALIEENKVLQAQLTVKITESEAAADKLEAKLKTHHLSMRDISEHEVDVETEIKARKKEVEALEEIYKANGCAETVSIYSCSGVPYADGFTRPLDKASVTSEYGWRRLAVYNYVKKFHYGMDFGVATGNKVYASAAGVVSNIVRYTGKYICAGNQVTIKHEVDGKYYRTVYMHLHTINVNLKDVVTINTVIGTSGGNEWYDTCSEGSHLHFGIRTGWTGGSYVNPRNYINLPAKNSRWTSRFY